jgi:plasmid stabilization system protein ParE
MARILRNLQARQDMRAIFEYIASESRDRAIALRYIDRFNSRLQGYTSQPEWGEQCPDLGENIRRVIFGNYITLYEPIKGGIRLLRVLDARQDYVAAWWRDQR